MKMNMIMKRFIGILTTMIIGLNLFSQQTLNDAIQLYNEGIDVINTNPDTALLKFSKCVEICDIIGPEADSTKMIAKGQIALCHYKIGLNQFKQEKYEDAINSLNKAKEEAIEGNNIDLKDKCNSYIPKLYYQLSTDNYKDKAFDKAIENINKAIEIDPTYSKAYYLKALVLEKQNKKDEMLTIIDKAIETSLQINDTKTLEKANQKASVTYIEKGFELAKKNDYKNAIELYKKALEYDKQSVEANYQLAVAYNKIEDWAKAIESANKAIQYEENNDTKRARIYYELGTAYYKLNNIEMSCSSFKKAMFGQFIEAAKYQIEKVVKCL
jgi:tetratricopeptide (TPR) repeat protein